MKKARKKNPGSRYVGLPHYLLDSIAFKTLPGDAVKLLLYIWKRHNGVNNGEISFGVREAAEIGISKTPASRMLTILIERGFLAIVREGGFNVGDRKTRTWRLTAEPCRGGPGSKEFMRWKPAQVPPAGPNKENPSLPTGTISPPTGTRAIKLPGLVPPQGLNGQKTASISPPTGTLIGYQAGLASKQRTCPAFVSDGRGRYRECGEPVGPGGEHCPDHERAAALGSSA